CRKGYFKQDGPRFGAERACCINKTAVDKLHTTERIDQDWSERRRENDISLRAATGAKPEHCKRRPGNRWNITEELEQRCDDPLKGAKVRHCQAERHPNYDCGGESPH